ncbi:recombinase [Pelobium manganitolerans]|uniref:Recombinase n=1 Tax=Pelobium manganitolerans TaxID=1842495 RepID=A0A419S4V0_9SPHI|nr:recombinase family protein [Pelobium manganitolerans]RKD15149.1 recombinase [Pelobium manganitolerans]
MKTAYLYVRVSTDEQKRKGYSLPEQEDRLLKYCRYNNIEVKGIYREDFSAKNFNRPEWKKLFLVIKSIPKEDKNILFIKWDRFSRNVEYAYEMIGMLRKYRTTAMAIDQPIDFSVPESTVMLAVYLSVPEAENSRRALNTANGMRRAKQMGRYPSKAPLGFINLTTVDGKKIIALKQPEAGIIRWAFLQLAKNIHTIEEVRKRADDRGLKCSRSYFFRLIRNPAYCGLVPIKSESGEPYTVKGIHEPIVSETLFHEVQNIINTKRKVTSKRDDLKATFFLRGILVCPLCDRKLCGSFSRGSTKRYPYYHCEGKCKTRINAFFLNECYERKLQQLMLSSGAMDLFKSILEDWNTGTQKAVYLQNRNRVIAKLSEQESILSQARKLFVADVLKTDDYSALKRECHSDTKCLKKELNDIDGKLRSIDQQSQLYSRSFVNIFQRFSSLDTTDRKHLVNLIPPRKVNFKTGDMSLELHNGLSKILSTKRQAKK